jgi:hypothetical protein
VLRVEQRQTLKALTPALPLDAYALCAHALSPLNCGSFPAPADAPAEALLVPKIEEAPDTSAACADDSIAQQVICSSHNNRHIVSLAARWVAYPAKLLTQRLGA